MTDWLQSSSGRHLGPALVATAAACAVGVAAAGLPLTMLVAVTTALAGLIFLLFARYYVNTGAQISPALLTLPAASVDSGGVTVAELVAPARYLYFAGMLTIAQTTVRPVLGLTLSDWLFFAALCAALVGLVVRPTAVTLRVPWVIILGVALFVASGLMSSVDALQPLQSVARVVRFGYLTLVWFWLGTLALTTWREVRIGMGCWVTSVALDGVAAVLQARGIQVPFLGPVMWGRMTGLTGHVNDLGGAAGVALAPAIAMAFTARRLGGLIYWCLALGGVVAALVLSGSVGGMAAGAGAVVVWVVVSSHGVRPVILVAAAVVVALGVIQLQSGLGLPTPVERVSAATGQSYGGEYSTIATRIQGYDRAWVSLGGGGWIGVGLDDESANLGQGVEIHNVFLKAWYEAGWLAGVGMLLVVLGALGYALVAARRSRPGRRRLIAVAVLSAVAAFTAFSMSAPVLHQRYGWVAVALAVTCVALTRSEAERFPIVGDDE